MEVMLLIHLILKQKKTGKTDNNERIDNVEIMVPLKYLSNFWRTPEMPLINCEIELILTWSASCVIIYTDVNNQIPTFIITETNLYIPVVTLSTQDNAKLLPQLKSGFKRKTDWNKYLAKPELLPQNPNLNHLIEPNYFKNCHKMIAIDLSKQQALDADPRAIQQINFTANLDRAGNTRFYFILEETKETIFEFSQGTVKVL